MTTMAGYKPGTFCWVDLATTDADGAKAFYGTLFGWEVVDIPIGDEDFYSMLKQNDRKVCALYKMRPEMMEHGVPPHWDSCVSVESADDAASKVADLGGSVVMEPFRCYGRRSYGRDSRSGRRYLLRLATQGELRRRARQRAE